MTDDPPRLHSVGRQHQPHAARALGAARARRSTTRRARSSRAPARPRRLSSPHKSPAEDPRAAGRRLHHRRKPGHHRLSLRDLRHRRKQRWSRPIQDCARRGWNGASISPWSSTRRSLYVMRRHRDLKHIYGEAPVGRRKRQRIFPDPAAPCGARAERRPALPGRRSLHQRRHAAHHLPGVGDRLWRPRAAGVQRLRQSHRHTAGLSGGPARQPAHAAAGGDHAMTGPGRIRRRSTAGSAGSSSTTWPRRTPSRPT